MLPLQAGLGKYCVHLLADYITLAAAPAVDSKAQHKGSAGFGHTEALAGAAGSALRQGAFALYATCSPAEVGIVRILTTSWQCC